MKMVFFKNVTNATTLTSPYRRTGAPPITWGHRTSHDPENETYTRYRKISIAGIYVIKIYTTSTNTDDTTHTVVGLVLLTCKRIKITIHVGDCNIRPLGIFHIFRYI